MQIASYGTWASPITPESMTRAQARIDEVRIDGSHTWWTESRPWEGGRSALVRHDPHTGATHDMLGRDWNVRSRVHEYGGGAYAIGEDFVVFSDFTTNRLYRIASRGHATPFEPTPITPESSVRYGALVVHERHVYAVREDHRAGGEPVNAVVRLDVDGTNADLGLVIDAQRSDFVSRPAVAHDGTQIAWVAWDHPNMPWDSTRLMVADLTHDGAHGHRQVAGGDGISVVAPEFATDGSLWFITDESGFWNPCRLANGDRRLYALDSDVAAPQWELGQVEYALRADGTVLLRRWVAESARLALLDPSSGEFTDIADEGTMFAHLQAHGSEVAYRRLLADRPHDVVRGPVDGERTVIGTSSPDAPDPAYVSVPEAWTWTNSAGQEVHGLLYRPRNPRFAAPRGEAPPLLVNVHGGPTARAEAAYFSGVQFWTSRGFAVLDVNHGGSTGYGRAYRERLRGQWGVVDIDDCLTGAASLADAGIVDGARLAIHGGSAGGYTVLRALTTSTVFTAGTSYFGISDLTGLLVDDHKFESRYTFGLVAPWPEGADVYAERSPIHHIDALHGELLLLQGADDLVVPVSQAQQMADAMRAAGKDVELVIYEGEGHGFRSAATIIDTLERELAHYQRAFGLD